MRADVALAPPSGNIAGMIEGSDTSDTVAHVERGGTAAIHVDCVINFKQEQPICGIAVQRPVTVSTLPAVNGHQIEITGILRCAIGGARLQARDRRGGIIGNADAFDD